MGIRRPEAGHKCLDCGEQRVQKPIAHEDSLDDPVGYLCLRCYSSWVQLTDIDEECVICGATAEYHTVRELSDADGEPVYSTGLLGACPQHIFEAPANRSVRPRQMH